MHAPLEVMNYRVLHRGAIPYSAASPSRPASTSSTYVRIRLSTALYVAAASIVARVTLFIYILYIIVRKSGCLAGAHHSAR